MTKTPCLRSVQLDEFLPPVSRWTTWGGIVLVGGVAVTIGLAALLRFNVTVKAAATVRPGGELRVVQAPQEGTIERIEVTENQTVQQGDIIAQLDRTRLDTQQRQLEGNLQQYQVQLTQLVAQIDLLNAQITAETRSLDREISVAQTELTRSQRDYQEQQTTTQANLTEAQAALALAVSEQQRYEQLVESGAVSQLQLEEKQAAVRSAEAQVARAQAALNPSPASVAVAQDRITQEQAQRRSALANLNREKEVLIQQQADLQAQVLRDRKELQQVQTDLQRTTLRATADGVILQLNLRNPDQLVNAGETIAEIAPSSTALVIKAAVATQDINRVEAGQTVQLRIDACPFPDFGTLKGSVTAVAPDVTPINSAENSSSNSLPRGDRAFEVTIQPAQTELTRGDRTCPLQAGMTAEANIISRRESLLKFILRKARLIAAV